MSNFVGVQVFGVTADGRVVSPEHPHFSPAAGPDDCDKCGHAVEIGEFPFCPHGRVASAYGKGFEPYFDYGLGEEVHGWGDIHKAMREHHLEYRDHPTKAAINDRLDRAAARGEGRQ